MLYNPFANISSQKEFPLYGSPLESGARPHGGNQTRVSALPHREEPAENQTSVLEVYWTPLMFQASPAGWRPQ